jgi:hypothetical protein
MSKTVQEPDLQTTPALGSEPGEFSGNPVCPVKTKRIATINRKRLDKKVTLRARQGPEKSGDEKRMAKATKKTNRSATKSKASDREPQVRAKAAKRTNQGVGDCLFAVDRIIVGTQPELESKDLSPAMGTPEIVEASRELVEPVNQTAHSEPEALSLEPSAEEPAVGVSRVELEFPMDPVAIRQPKSWLWVSMVHCLAESWNWMRRQVRSRRVKKRLRVCETLSLGEKRFIAVIQVDGEQFLVGGASSSMATLARLEPSGEFSEVLKQQWAQDPVQA